MAKKNLQKRLEKLTILLVTHSRTTGFSQMLRNWLKGKVQTLVFIDHPLYPTKELNSSLVVYKNGILKQSCQSRYLLSSGILLYAKDLLTTLGYVFKSKERFDIAIGVDNSNTLALLLLKKLKRIKKVVYHTVDYTPHRFPNRILNSIYHFIDRWCCYRADMLWNSSGRMNQGRIKNNAKKDKIALTIITPDGSNFDPKKRLPLAKINRKMIVFLGHLRPGMGLEMLLESFVRIRKKVPEAKLTIIGDGPLMKKLKKITQSNQLLVSVIFTGFIKSHERVDNILRKGAIGVALFEPIEDSIEYYSDVGKPKVYLAAGLPVVITKVPEIAWEIDQGEAGIAVNYHQSDFTKAVITLLENDSLYKKYRQNAIELSKKYLWDNIFTDAFSKTLALFINPKLKSAALRKII